MTCFGPQIGSEPNFHLGPEPNFQKSNQTLLFQISLKPVYSGVFREIHSKEKGKTGKHRKEKTNFWHFWKQGVVKKAPFVATPNLGKTRGAQKQPNKKQNQETKKKNKKARTIKIERDLERTKQKKKKTKEKSQY